MNAFLKGFFNVPDGDIIGIFDFNTEKYDPYRSNETFDFIKAVYNLDIKAIISKSNKIVDDEYKKKVDEPTLADYFREMIHQIDTALDITELFEELELDDKQKEKVAKDHNGVKNRLDYIFVKEQSMEDIASHKIEYLLCNIYQIIMNVNFHKSYDFIDYIIKFKELVKTEKSVNSDNNDGRVAISSLERHQKDYYSKNFLSYLFLPEKEFVKYSGYEWKKITEKLEGNYCCAEAMDEIQIPSILHGASNTYRNIEKGKYPINTLNRFAKDYHATLEKVHNYYAKSKDISGGGKADIIHKYSKISLYSNKYISEMFYSFKYIEFYLKETERCINGCKDKISKTLYKMLFDTYALTFLIPDINRRKLYTTLVSDVFIKHHRPDLDSEINELTRCIYYETQVYYPILVLSAMVCLAELAKREKESKNAAKFFLNNAEKALIKINCDVEKLSVEYEPYLRSKYAEYVYDYYKAILHKFLNIYNYRIFYDKITTYNSKRRVFNKLYINKLINVYEDEIDKEEHHNGKFNTPYIVFRENLYEKLSDTFKDKLFEFLYNELPGILHNELYCESDDENSDTEIEE